jgi:hypothetical protein
VISADLLCANRVTSGIMLPIIKPMPGFNPHQRLPTLKFLNPRNKIEVLPSPLLLKTFLTLSRRRMPRILRKCPSSLITLKHLTQSRLATSTTSPDPCNSGIEDFPQCVTAANNRGLNSPLRDLIAQADQAIFSGFWVLIHATNRDDRARVGPRWL